MPLDGKAGGTPVDVNDFAHSKKLLLINSPDEYITRVPVTVSVPQFFLAAGATDEGDVQAAELFRQELLLRDADVPLEIVPGGGHQATVWRAALTPMFDWMTPQLAKQVAIAEWAAKQQQGRRGPQGRQASRCHQKAGHGHLSSTDSTAFGRPSVTVGNSTCAIITQRHRLNS